MDTDAETIELGNMVVHIKQDEEPLNPREEFDHLCKMVCFHRSYNLGDKHDFDSSDYSSWDELRGAIIEQEHAVEILPLYLYYHSGLSISMGGRNIYWMDSGGWDSGVVGFIYLTREDVLKEYGWKRLNPARHEQLVKLMAGEVEEYDQYLTGQVYGYEIETEEGEFIDSRWGFYGLDYCKQEGKELAEYHIQHADA